MLPARAVDLNAAPLVPIRNRGHAVKAARADRGFTVGLAEDRHISGEQFHGPHVPMIAVGMRDQHRIDLQQEGL